MSDKELVSATITALAAIDAELGLPEDGCNSTARTLTAIRLLHSVHRDDVAEIERLHEQMERGTAALRVAFGEELWRLGHPAYVVVHLREEIEKVTRLWKAATVERDALRARVEAAEKDAARYRWLTSDHDDPWVRQHCREILERMGVMSYSATSTAIDTALEIEQFHAIDAAMEGGK